MAGVRNEVLEQAIRDRSWNLEHAATEFGITRSTLTRYISGKVPPRKRAKLIASNLGLPLRTLWPALASGEVRLPKLQLSGDSLDVLCDVMRSAKRSVLICCGWMDQYELPVDLLLEEIAICIGNNVHVTVDIAIRDKVYNRTFSDSRQRKRLLDGLGRLSNEKLTFNTFDAASIEDGLSARIDREQIYLTSSFPKVTIHLQLLQSPHT